MWYKIKNKVVQLNIFAKPNAKKTNLLGIINNELQISLHAKPHYGEANKELIAYLAGLLHLPKSNIILHGTRSRHKRVMLPLTKTVQDFITDLKELT